MHVCGCGLNVIELEKWRDLRVTSLYVQSLQKVSRIHHSP